MNNVPTPDLSKFLVEVKKIKANESFRIDIMSISRIRSYITMKKNIHDFPTVQWTNDLSTKEGWVKKTLEFDERGVR